MQEKCKKCNSKDLFVEIQGQAEYQRQEKEMLLDKFKRMFEDGGRKMSADEMFEKLGYVKYEYENEYVNEIEYIANGLDRIVFDKKIKYIELFLWNSGARVLAKSLNMEELQAIYQKCKEMGWINNIEKMEEEKTK